MTLNPMPGADVIYAIGDIHGQKAQLDRALALIAADGGAAAPVVFLGDYVDRGPDSRGVIETLIAGRQAGRPWHCIKGNHDRAFHNYLTTGSQHDANVKSGLSWINDRMGGAATLASYGITGRPVLGRGRDGLEWQQGYDRAGRSLSPETILAEARAAVPQAHLDFLRTLPLTHRQGDLLFVHAGLRPGVPLDAQVEDDLIWIRDGWLQDTRDHGPLVVHGHTALDRPQHHGNRVNLDGGAGYGRPLVPAVFTGRACHLLTETGRIPLHPAQ